MQNFHFPFSGDVPVTQAINPWEFWIKSFSSQMGLININNVSSSDRNIEKEVIENVASYGRQLGRVNDLLETIIDNPGLKDLSSRQQRSIEEFREMVDQIKQVKQKWKSPARLLSALDDMISAVNAIRETHPQAYEEALNRLHQGLDPDQKR